MTHNCKLFLSFIQFLFGNWVKFFRSTGSALQSTISISVSNRDSVMKNYTPPVFFFSPHWSANFSSLPTITSSSPSIWKPQRNSPGSACGGASWTASYKCFGSLCRLETSRPANSQQFRARYAQWERVPANNEARNQNAEFCGCCSNAVVIPTEIFFSTNKQKKHWVVLKQHLKMYILCWCKNTNIYPLTLSLKKLL